MGRESLRPARAKESSTTHSTRQSSTASWPASNFTTETGAPLAPARAGGDPIDGHRTKGSSEQLEDSHLPNPITDRDASLGEAGDALNPQGEEPEMDKDEAEGPVPRTTQMPR